MSPEAVASLIAENTELKTENLRLKDQIADLTYQHEWLKRQIFGQKSERFIHTHDAQCSLALEVLPPVNGGPT